MIPQRFPHSRRRKASASLEHGKRESGGWRFSDSRRRKVSASLELDGGEVRLRLLEQFQTPKGVCLIGARPNAPRSSEFMHSRRRKASASLEPIRR